MPHQNTSANPTKDELRRRFRTARRSLSDAERTDLSSRIVSHIAHWLNDLEVQPATLALYLATPNEANLDALIAILQARGVRVVAPRDDGFATVSAASTCSVDSGSWRAANGEAVSTQEIDIVLLPGVAFGRDGSRLGQGGGWYDRALQGSHAVLVGVCFGCQMTESLPMEAHDVPMQWLVCEREMARVKPHNGRAPSVLS